MKLNAIFILICCFVVFNNKSQAQWDSYRQDGEIGVSGGFTHYYGDLNDRVRINYIQPVVGAFYRRQFGNYVAARISAHFAQTGYSDKFNESYNPTLARRNLSFFTNIFEATLQGDFNFFKYRPGDKTHAFTPYLTFGVGIFSYDPYTMIDTGSGQLEKFRLLDYATEPNKPTTGNALCFPFGVGVKYAINRQITLGAEVVYRFTNTDYLDDVSKEYAPVTVPNNTNNKISDPSWTTDPATGLTYNPLTGLYYDRLSVINPKQRGYTPNANDHYLFAQVTLSFNLISYHCPKAD